MARAAPTDEAAASDNPILVEVVVVWTAVPKEAATLYQYGPPPVEVMMVRAATMSARTPKLAAKNRPRFSSLRWARGLETECAGKQAEVVRGTEQCDDHPRHLESSSRVGHSMG